MYSLYLFCFVCDPKSRQPRKNKCETLQVNPRLGRAATTGQARNAMPHSSCHGEADSPPKTSKKKMVWLCGCIDKFSFVQLQVVSQYKKNEANNRTIGEKCTKEKHVNQEKFLELGIAKQFLARRTGGDWKAKSQTYQTFHKRKKSIEQTTMSLYNTPGEFLKVSDPPRSDNYRVPHKNDVPRQTKPEKATAPPAQLESSNAILPTPGNQKSTKTCQACLILSGSMSKICLKTVVGKMMCGCIVCGWFVC